MPELCLHLKWSFRVIHSRTFEPSHTSLILLRIKVVVPNGKKGLVPHNNGLFSVKVCRQICFLPNTDPPLSRGGKAHLIFECGRANSNDFNFWKQNKKHFNKRRTLPERVETRPRAKIYLSDTFLWSSNLFNGASALSSPHDIDFLAQKKSIDYVQTYPGGKLV